MSPDKWSLSYATLQGTVLRIILSVVERCLREHSPACPVTARIGAVAYIHRFGSSLNEHVHFHCCVIDGAAEMRAWAHDGGFSVDGSVRIEGADRIGLERLLRYCARPPFALEHLHQRDAEHLVYRNPKPVRTTVPGARPAALVLTPLELITKIAALVPPPRAHRHHYYGVLAPNAQLRAVVTALAPAAVSPAPTSAATREESRHRSVARYLWAMLLARMYEAFPLQCPICHSQMHIIAFINDAGTVKKILDHIGESTQPPRIAPARGPPLWEAVAARRNRWRTILSGIRQPSPHRRSSAISASPGRRNQDKPPLVRGVTRACKPRNCRQRLSCCLQAVLGVRYGSFMVAPGTS